MNTEEKRNSVKHNYNLIAQPYSSEFGTYIEELDIYEEFEKYLSEGAKILDLGAGSGRTYSYFNKMNITKNMDNGLDTKEVARLINFIIDTPSDVMIPEVGIKNINN